MSSILDNFNRADEETPTGWTEDYGTTGFNVASNKLAVANGGENWVYWNDTFNPDVEAYITIDTPTVAGGNAMLLARWDRAGANGYRIFIGEGSPDAIALSRLDNFVGTDIGSWSQELAAGDAIGIRCIGALIQAWVRLSGVWTKLGEGIDTTYSGMAPNNRVAIYTNGNGSSVARFDDFGGGAAVKESGERVGPFKRAVPESGTDIENAVSLLPILDDFNRANENTPSGWIDYKSNEGMKIVSNQMAADMSAALCIAYFNTAMGQNVQARITIPTLPSTDPAGSVESMVLARYDPVVSPNEIYGSGYYVKHIRAPFTPSQIEIGVLDRTVSNPALASFLQDLANGDILRIRCIGSTIEASVRASGIWKVVGSVTDTTIDGSGANNKLAVGVYEMSPNARFDDFAGGTI